MLNGINPRKAAAANPANVVTIAKTISSFFDKIFIGYGLRGALILSTSKSKRSFTIIADAEIKNAVENPNKASVIVGRLPNAIYFSN